MRVSVLIIMLLTFRTTLRNFAGIATVLALALLIACRPNATPAPRTSATAQRYDLKGKVISVDKPQKRVMLEHEEIPGYMDAMTMPFAIRDGEMLGALGPGDVVTGKLAVENNVSWIEVQSIVKPSEPIPGATPAPEVKAGDEVPNVELTNQDGKKITLRQYRGKIVLLTFIYTRCPLPDYCILMSENFGEISKVVAARPKLKSKVHLLSVSFDSDFDKPEVLKTYGKNYMSRFTPVDFKLWEFASGNPADIKNFTSFFGLAYFPQNNQINHSLRTIFIDPQGKVAQVFSGNEWKPTEAIAVLEQIAGLKK